MKAKEFKVDNFATMFREVTSLVSPECPLVIIERTDVGGHPWCYLAVYEAKAEVITLELNWQRTYPKNLTQGAGWFVISKPKEDIIEDLQRVFGENIDLEEVSP